MTAERRGNKSLAFRRFSGLKVKTLPLRSTLGQNVEPPHNTSDYCRQGLFFLQGFMLELG